MLVDTHAHLMDSAFREDLAEVLERAAAADVGAIVCVGYDEDSSREAVHLAETYPQLVAAVGIHPNYAGQATAGAFDRLRQLATHARVVGIGETGLDNYRQHTPPRTQREWFERHLELGAELRLPVVVHNRQADEEVAEMLMHRASSDAPVAGVLHCFSGDAAMLSAGLAAGFMVSFAGPLTFKNAGSLPELARRVPLDRLVVETDCPYLTPAPHRGQRNEPALVRWTAERLAQLRGMPFDQLARATTDNARRLFPGLSADWA
ncbi:MAG: TatD family hydrolase [Chloroflexi bacterium]|nr:TatD family hydrolase [Chloroflexota bacterium]